MTSASASKLFGEFAVSSDDGLGSCRELTEERFMKMLGYLQEAWGLQAEDTEFVFRELVRWRFRTNAATGTRGLALWPLQKDEFIAAYPCLLRSVRDRYVPIGGRLRRSLFVR